MQKQRGNNEKAPVDRLNPDLEEMIKEMNRASHSRKHRGK